jgi:hypothetical protein
VPDALLPLSSYRSPSHAFTRRFASLSTRGREALDLSVFLGRTDRDLATDFRALLRCRARSVRSGVTPHGLPMLSWTLSSLGSAARDDGLDFARPPPVLRPTRFPVKGCASACTPECCSFAVVVSSLSRVPSPSEVYRLLWSPPFGTARSWVTPRGRPSVTGGRYPSSERGGTLLTPGVTTDWRPD